MNKREQKKFESLLASMAKVNPEFNLEQTKEELQYLYSHEESMYEGQSVLNFYKARIQPRLGEFDKHGQPKEFPGEFDKRYREWRIRICEGCNEEYAYAFNYDGVKYCSLECLDDALHKIGLQVTRGRELKKRWGVFYHPAIVPSSAFAVLKASFAESVPDAFVMQE